MTATWDLFVKDLVRERPQDFATLVLPGSPYIGRRESQYQMREVRLDRLIEVEYGHEPRLESAGLADELAHLEVTSL